jgi:indolepyruvate ferredoxin oxidoreductase, alpha subunit
VREALIEPDFDVGRIVLPPMSYAQEQDKVEEPLARGGEFIREHGLNERFGPGEGRVGIICQGGMYNA